MGVGSKQRRERECQELRQAILSAARDIAAREGWQEVTIRKIAEAIEYTPPIIYEYFASKEALLLELLREGFRQVMQGLGGVPFGTSETPPEARNAFAAVRETVHAALEAHGVRHPDLDGDVDILWSTLHGLISLTMTGRIAGGESRAASLVERAVNDLLVAWEVEEREAPARG